MPTSKPPPAARRLRTDAHAGQAKAYEHVMCARRYVPIGLRTP